MNTKEDLERIEKHCHNMPSFTTTPLIEWINIIAGKLDEYAATIESHKVVLEEKQKVIDRLLNNTLEL